MHPIMKPNQDIQTQICRVCKGNLPLCNFGFIRYAESGRRNECKDCRSQSNRLFRKRKYGAISERDDSIIRDLNKHNKECILQALSTNETIFYAYSYKDLKDIHIEVKCIKLNYYVMEAFVEGKELFRYGFDKSLKDLVDFLGLHLVKYNIRLERSEVDRIDSKVFIYSQHIVVP